MPNADLDMEGTMKTLLCATVCLAIQEIQSEDVREVIVRMTLDVPMMKLVPTLTVFVSVTVMHVD